jgi:hypothetical protein
MGIQSSAFPIWRLLSRSVQLWVGVIFFIVGIVFTVIGIQTLSTEQAYRTTGSMIDATVLGKSIERAKQGENSRTRYVVNYRFLADHDQEIESVTEVPVEEWEILEAGSQLQVTYLPHSPETNRVDGENEWIAALVFMSIGGIFTLLGGGLALTDLRWIIRAIRVSRHGLITQGTVVRAEPTSIMINRIPQWSVSYRYRDNLGHEHEGTSHLISPKEGGLWKKGDSGTVRFDDKRPSISVWIGRA